MLSNLCFEEIKEYGVINLFSNRIISISIGFVRIGQARYVGYGFLSSIIKKTLDTASVFSIYCRGNLRQYNQFRNVKRMD